MRRESYVLAAISDTLGTVLERLHEGDVLLMARSGGGRLAVGERHKRLGSVLVPDLPPHLPQFVKCLVDPEGTERGCLKLGLDGSWRLEVPSAGLVLP